MILWSPAAGVHDEKKMHTINDETPLLLFVVVFSSGFFLSWHRLVAIYPYKYICVSWLELYINILVRQLRNDHLHMARYACFQK